MATGASFSGAGWSGLDELRRNWGWFLALGISLIILGVIALSFSVLTTLASVIVFGWLLIVSGVLQAVHAFWRKRWNGFFLDLFGGILSLVVGFMLVANPLVGAETLTMLIALFLFIGGIFRIVVSLTAPFHNWGWLLLNGVINVVLGVLIWRQWPVSGLWVIGLFVGIDMLFNGWSLVMLSLTARTLPEHA
jgi:uncharacterized membrane protein HdeD (DUF308 family)